MSSLVQDLKQVVNKILQGKKTYFIKIHNHYDFKVLNHTLDSKDHINIKCYIQVQFV